MKKDQSKYTDALLCINIELLGHILLSTTPGGVT